MLASVVAATLYLFFNQRPQPGGSFQRGKAAMRAMHEIDERHLYFADLHTYSIYISFVLIFSAANVRFRDGAGLTIGWIMGHGHYFSLTHTYAWGSTGVRRVLVLDLNSGGCFDPLSDRKEPHPHPLFLCISDYFLRLIFRSSSSTNPSIVKAGVFFLVTCNRSMEQ